VKSPLTVFIHRAVETGSMKLVAGTSVMPIYQPCCILDSYVYIPVVIISISLFDIIAVFGITTFGTADLLQCYSISRPVFVDSVRHLSIATVDAMRFDIT